MKMQISLVGSNAV